MSAPVPYPAARYAGLVTVRWWRKRVVGSADEAARVCGLTGDRRAETYQYYVKRLKAPGPIWLRDPDSGKQLFDLQDVAEWDMARPGRGWRRGLTNTRKGTS